MAAELKGDAPNDTTPEITHVERTLSGPELEKEHVDYSRIDTEVAKYAGGDVVVLDKAEDKRLKTMIDRRVLVIMILTYFLQAIDKGTMSFTSIMGILDDVHIAPTQVSYNTSISAYLF